MGERSGWDGSPTAGAGGVEAASFGRVRRSGVFKRKTLGPGLSFVHCFFKSPRPGETSLPHTPGSLSTPPPPGPTRTHPPSPGHPPQQEAPPRSD